MLDLLRREEEAECEAAAREEAEAEELAFFPGEEPSARSLALKKIRSAAAKANDGVGDKHMESKHMNYTAGAGEVARVLAKFAEEVHVTNLKGVVLVKKKKSQSEFVKEVPWLNPPKLRKYLKKGEENWEDGKFDANNKEHLERRTQRALRHYQGMRRDAKKSGAGRRSFYPEEETRVHRWFVQQRASGLRVTSAVIEAEFWKEVQKLPEEERPRDPRQDPASHWLRTFCKRFGLRLREATHVAQQLPAELEDKKLRYLKYMIKVQRRLGDPLEGASKLVFINMDQTPFYRDPGGSGKTWDVKGAKTVNTRGTSAKAARRPSRSSRRGWSSRANRGLWTRVRSALET